MYKGKASLPTPLQRARGVESEEWKVKSEKWHLDEKGNAKVNTMSDWS